MPLVICRSRERPEQAFLAWGDDIPEVLAALEKACGPLDLSTMRVLGEGECLRFHVGNARDGGLRVFPLPLAAQKQAEDADP